MKETRKCVIEGCGKTHMARGLCHYHYHKFARMVREKKITWEQLEAEGKSFRDNKPWAKYPPKRVRCLCCNIDYPSIRQAALGCGYSAPMVSSSMKGRVPFPKNHHWVELGPND